MTATENFLKLFSPHSVKSYGEYRETGAEDPAKTVKLMVGLAAVERHLRGEVGLGLVPLDGEKCGWAVLDIDNHGGEKVNARPPGDVDLDYKHLARQFSGYPGTVVTRSKSGGAHIYFFFKEVIKGKEARGIVHQVAMATGYAGDEVFPKQNKIRVDGWGNWINLPYFRGDDTDRYGITPDGEKMSMSTFFATPRATPADLEGAIENASIGAPPCIERLLKEPPAQGHRNMALFSLAVFFKRSSPNTWQDKTQDYALKRMDPPLPAQEIRNAVRSVGRTDYMYRCTEPPLLDLCDKEKCLLARHGLTTSQQVSQGEPVLVKSLVKYLTEPPVWDLNTELGPVRVSTKALLSHAMIREAIAERYLKIIPKLKTEEWHALLSDLMAQCEVIEVPEDASPSGLVWNALLEYSAVAYTEDNVEKDEKNEEAKWEAGLPINKDGTIFFAGSKFISWLRRAKRAEGMQPSQIYMALKERKLTQSRMRIGGQVKRSWAFPVALLRKSYPVYTGEEEDF